MTTTSPLDLRVPPDVQLVFPMSSEHEEWSILANLALLAFTRGDQPYLRRVMAWGKVDPEALLPDSCSVQRQLVATHASALLISGDGWTATITANRSGHIAVLVTAISNEVAQLVAKEIAAKFPAEEENADAVRMIFWHHNGMQIRHHVREIEAPGWDAIRANYPAPAREALHQLMVRKPPITGGRLLILHGEPGTGKTTALRALSRTWEPWCRSHYVVDADRLFASSAYLLEVISNETPGVPGAQAPARPWRLVIVEDCDEFIRADAKNATGQALSKLLNVTDGMVGQGYNVLFCITTNEDVRRLHPAVVRPGRCLANIAVGRFTQAEASAWLDRPAPAHGATLAELFVLRGEQAPVETAGAVADHIGAYL